MNEILRQKMIFSKTTTLMYTIKRAKELEQKRNEGILTEEEKATLERLRKSEDKTRNEISKLYSID